MSDPESVTHGPNGSCYECVIELKNVLFWEVKQHYSSWPATVLVHWPIHFYPTGRWLMSLAGFLHVLKRGSSMVCEFMIHRLQYTKKELLSSGLLAH